MTGHLCEILASLMMRTVSRGVVSSGAALKSTSFASSILNVGIHNGIPPRSFRSGPQFSRSYSEQASQRIPENPENPEKRSEWTKIMDRDRSGRGCFTEKSQNTSDQVTDQLPEQSFDESSHQAPDQSSQQSSPRVLPHCRWSNPFLIPPAITKWSQEYNLHYAIRFGQPLIFDLAQEREMNYYESSSFVRQMRQIYSDNRAQWEPFHIHLCNYDPELPGLKELAEGEQSAGYLWEVTKDCFTQRFPLERLVYLSPDAPEVASEWRHDDVYIVGGVVDKGGGDKMTLSKIKKMGIRSQRFDIDRYFTKKKTPAMTLDQVFACLLDARDTDGNWLYSYRHFPKRMVTWRPQFSCMQNVPHINTPDDLFQWQRSIVKPRTKDFPYSKLLAVNDDDNDEDDWEWA